MNFQNALSFARGVITSSSRDNSGPLLPWEKGPFSRIFADDDAKPLSQVSLPEVPIPDSPRFGSNGLRMARADLSQIEGPSIWLKWARNPYIVVSKPSVSGT